MADDERTPGVTPSDAFVAQQRDVEAAIAALERSLGGRGATFLKHVGGSEAPVSRPHEKYTSVQ